MYHFPKDLYADIRIEEKYSVWMTVRDHEMISDGESTNKCAFIRVFDGTMWYNCSTDNISEIQNKLDNLAKVATANSDIDKNPMVERLEVNRATVLHFDGENNIQNVSRAKWQEVLDHYIAACVDETIPEMNIWGVSVSGDYIKKSFYSSKGTEIVQDIQNIWLRCGYGFMVDKTPTYGGKNYSVKIPDELWNHEDEICKERDRYLDFARNAKAIEPGEYTCVLSPFATALFTHESFGHKSEADYMLNDETLREEWVLGKTVGSEKVTICDDGEMFHHGYVPYDDEGTKARRTYLMKKGKLTGRLHDANSASILKEGLTGNCRAGGPMHAPIVRMTNTFMEKGNDSLEDMIAGVEDGLYIYMIY